MAGSGTPVRSDRWYDQATRASSAAGELRLVLNIEGLLGTAHFRSYWIQRNISDLRQYRAGVVDLTRDRNGGAGIESHGKCRAESGARRGRALSSMGESFHG